MNYGQRVMQPRHYLMCRPTFFDVIYSINPWMHPEKPTDASAAVAQWETLRELYLHLGHQVSVIEPDPELPDMVYAANGATVVDGRVLGARFRYPQRAPEEAIYLDWLRRHGFSECHEAQAVNEGEGDMLTTASFILAGHGFRSTPDGHAEAQEFFGRPVIGLRLVDPRFYHLDTALAVLDGDEIMYYPPAFSPGSNATLRRLFPDALIVERADAEVFALNAVSDGRHVVLPETAPGVSAQLRERGFEPLGVDMSELLKGGGSAKCCTLELRPAVDG